MSLHITTYKAYWNERLMAWGLSYQQVRESLNSHWAYGEPDNNNPHLGIKWASDENDDGWRIVQEQQLVYEAHGKLHNWNDSGEDSPLLHVHWKCPVCEYEQTCDVDSNDTPPALWGCGNSQCSRDVFVLMHW